MSKKKSSTTQTQSQNNAYSNTSAGGFNTQNQYGWEQMPDSPDVKAFREYRPQIDPGIGYQAANARNRLNSSFINPLGANYSPVMQDQILRAGNRDIDQTESQAFRAGNYDVNQQRAGQLGALAALTAPRMVQRGSTGTTSGTSSGTSSGTATGTSNTTQGNNLFGDIMGTAQSAASMAML